VQVEGIQAAGADVPRGMDFAQAIGYRQCALAAVAARGRDDGAQLIRRTEAFVSPS
jgi:hypothetical protein